MPRAKVDPELLRQLNDAEKAARAGGGGGDVQAVFTLAGAVASGSAPTAEGTKRAAHAVLERARAASGTAPSDVHVFGNLGTFVVVARPEFLRALVNQPGIASAAPNRRPGLGATTARTKRPVATHRARSRPTR